jgi:phosphomannomutase
MLAHLNYVPVPLAFGTSGLRGLVTDITDLEAYINVVGTLRYLARSRDIRPASTIVLGGDLRPSTERIMRACAQAVLDWGGAVEYCGNIPTPALIYRSITTARAGVMVTGSHIPFDRNGIKINKSVGEILKSDEAGILAEVERARNEEYGRSLSASPFDASGMLKRAAPLPPRDSRAELAYIARYVDGFARVSLSGLRVLVYQHSAVGRDILATILTALGFEVVTAGRSDTFVPIDTENITSAQLELLEGLATAAETAGRPLDAIVSTDGDSDRPLVLATVAAGPVISAGRRVRFLPGDLLGLVAAEYLGADAAVVPISANDAVERRMRESGVILVKSKIGSPYVIAALEGLRGVGGYNRIVGWEANGGFLTATDIGLKGASIRALPTRDAVLPIVATLFAAVGQGITLSALWDRLPARFGAAGLLDNFPVAVSQTILANLVPPGDVIEVEFANSGQALDRSSAGTAPAALGKSATEEWLKRKAILEKVFTAALGFTDIARLNVLDGARIYFANGDIAHIRPSGNAPQLRIYANSDSQQRADRLVELALLEPDGILRQLERAFT